MMLAFHSDNKIKNKYLKRVEAHIKADNLVRGATGKDGKGCAVACTLDMVYDHSRYPIELGIPEWLARVEDTLFESMSIDKSKTFPKEFLEAIKVGSDLEKAKTPFIVIVLKSTIESMLACKYDEAKNPDVKAAIDGSIKAVEMMIHAQENGLDLSAAWSAASAARSAARSAAWSAASAAESAAWSAAESAAWSAAESAAWSAASAAWSAWSAASAAESAAWSAASAAESAAYDFFADELLRIIREL